MVLQLLNINIAKHRIKFLLRKDIISIDLQLSLTTIFLDPIQIIKQKIMRETIWEIRDIPQSRKTRN